jgi:hypothetical protein
MITQYDLTFRRPGTSTSRDSQTAIRDRRRDVAAVIGGTAQAARRSAADGIASLRKIYPDAAISGGQAR